MAADGNACVPFEATSEQQSGFAVFDAEGLLRELLVLDGPEALSAAATRTS